MPLSYWINYLVCQIHVKIFSFFIYKLNHVFNKHFWLNEVLCYVQKLQLPLCSRLLKCGAPRLAIVRAN